MANIFFTSDHHFDHANIIRYSNRPFSSVGEMNEILIQRWNERIKPEDKVYHLGDFCFKDRQKFIDRLNGKKVFIKGSHDKVDAPYMMVETFKEYKDEYGNPRVITLCHYAMRSWDRSHYATFSLHGHHHGSLEPYGLSFDVGVDCWNFYPVSFEEVEKKMKTLKPIVDFRNKTGIL